MVRRRCAVSNHEAAAPQSFETRRRRPLLILRDAAKTPLLILRDARRRAPQDDGSVPRMRAARSGALLIRGSMSLRIGLGPALRCIRQNAAPRSGTRDALLHTLSG